MVIVIMMKMVIGILIPGYNYYKLKVVSALAQRDSERILFEFGG